MEPGHVHTVVDQDGAAASDEAVTLLRCNWSAAWARIRNSWSFNRAQCTGLMMAAARRPVGSDPANGQFDHL
ncbi:hypothetical protein J7E62_31510 [Variovorax paradoxus]|nr:hypothetical protein [Variovorax paradoxus]